MPNMIDIPLSEIAEALCAHHLRPYADQLALQQSGANKHGIVVQYSESRMAIMFQFVVRDMPGAYITMTVDAKRFIENPIAYVANLHKSLILKIEEFHKDQGSIMVYNALPDAKQIAAAVSKEMH